ncbi:hypothetical protein RBH26_07965 [Natronolimnohabitans sp. A-GB9]|uniref:hypothetical protein n=1 Tax=Natronolimnohabitans sp. A-GB9 TaxID=3069757 RepID=UPI0027B20D06|nr:hypothetical protein [Natronolimnohabitans sp. A-GB9]MDQ2050421.1 hypothetical protein [Natronolimnohabitans sp. A-GB9]
MTDDELHEPEFSGTTIEEWNEPRLEDFDTDNVSTASQRLSRAQSITSGEHSPPERQAVSLLILSDSSQ